MKSLKCLIVFINTLCIYADLYPRSIIDDQLPRTRDSWLADDPMLDDSWLEIDERLQEGDTDIGECVE
jgi:hypothetical protein